MSLCTIARRLFLCGIFALQANSIAPDKPSASHQMQEKIFLVQQQGTTQPWMKEYNSLEQKLVELQNVGQQTQHEAYFGIPINQEELAKELEGDAIAVRYVALANSYAGSQSFETLQSLVAYYTEHKEALSIHNIFNQLHQRFSLAYKHTMAYNSRKEEISSFLDENSGRIHDEISSHEFEICGYLMERNGKISLITLSTQPQEAFSSAVKSLLSHDNPDSYGSAAYLIDNYGSRTVAYFDNGKPASATIERLVRGFLLLSSMRSLLLAHQGADSQFVRERISQVHTVRGTYTEMLEAQRLFNVHDDTLTAAMSTEGAAITHWHSHPFDSPPSKRDMRTAQILGQGLVFALNGDGLVVYEYGPIGFNEVKRYSR